MNTSEIRDLRDFLVNDVHSNRLNQQETDLSYYEDTHPVPFIQDPKHVIRTGATARLIDNITEQIVTDKPVVTRLPKDEKETNKNRALKISSWLNREAEVLNFANPNRFKESVKKTLIFGESWRYVVHNPNFASEDYPNVLPFDIYIPHPMVVFFDPRMGETNGIPNKLIVYFQRNVGDIKRIYPSFLPKTNKKKVPFLMYFDNDYRYFEAGDQNDEQPLLRDANGDLSNGTGIQENIYGFVPFVHSYSGFGQESVDGDPASLAVGRIRKVRGQIADKVALRSNISYIIYELAHPNWRLENRSGSDISDDMVNNLDFGAGKLNVINLPQGAEFIKDEGLEMSQQIFSYYGLVSSELMEDNPPNLYGLTSSESGRQEDIAGNRALNLYNSVIRNENNAFATAMSLGLRMCEKLELFPPNVSSSDIQKDYTCNVELKAQDPLEIARKVSEGFQLWKNGAIDYEEFAIKYLNKTQEEAKKMNAKIWIEQAMRTNPAFQQLIIQTAAQEMGKEEELAMIEQQMNPNQPALNPVPNIGERGGTPRTGNVQNPEFADQSIMKEPRKLTGGLQ